MLKVAYVLHWNDGPESGVFKKVAQQVSSWSSAGCRVELFLLTRSPELYAEEELFGQPVQVSRYRALFDRFGATEELTRAVVAWQPDVVYHRYDLWYPALGKLAETVPMVAEINTDDLSEYRLGPKARQLYSRATRGLILGKVAGFVFVSEELSRKPQYLKFHKPSRVIGNSVRLSLYRSLPPPNNPRPRLAFLGSAQPWQGVDKVIALAAQFSDWDFEVIGLGRAAWQGSFPANVRFHGFLDRTAYEEVLATCDVAIGTLALHRKGMEETSPLKLREYLAYGIPTIIGYIDTDFPTSHPYILQLPNTADNVVSHRTSIERFVGRVRGTRVPRHTIAHLDVGVKEHDRLSFLRTFVKSSGTGCVRPSH